MIVLCCCACEAQSLTIGVAGGGRATDDVSGSAIPESKRYVVGPMVDVGLTRHFSVEIDALYHRQGYEIGASNFAGYIIDRERGNSWEFPILAKYALPVGRITPFVEVGFAPSIVSGNIAFSGANIDIMTGQQTPFNGTERIHWTASVGVVAGGGVQFGFGRVRLAPEVRYTHWTSTPLQGYFGHGVSFASATEQVEALVGVGWKFGRNQ